MAADAASLKKARVSSRERKRLRRETEHRRRLARAAAIAQEAAARREATHEDMAPRQQRIGTELREATAVLDPKVGAFRRSSSIWLMHRQNPGLITTQHLAAANRYTSDYEVAFGGAKPSATSARVDGAAAPDIPARVLDAVRRVNATRRALGPLGDPVAAVLLWGWSIDRLAAWRHLPHQKMSGYLVAGLDTLVGWYWPHTVRRIESAVPEWDVADDRVADVPQERLGRWDRSPELAEA